MLLSRLNNIILKEIYTMTNNEMQGKVCLITGANGSIGKYRGLPMVGTGATRSRETVFPRGMRGKAN